MSGNGGGELAAAARSLAEQFSVGKLVGKVDAQVFTTTDGQALDSISVSREFDDEADEQRRARKIGDLIEQALAGTVRLPEIVAARNQPRSRQRAFTLETSILVDNSWSNQFTVI